MNPLNHLLDSLETKVTSFSALRFDGKITQVLRSTLRANLPNVRVGELCKIVFEDSDRTILAEVSGFQGAEVLLSPLDDMTGVSIGTRVIPTGETHHVGVGDTLLGRVLSGVGLPLDEHVKGPLVTHHSYPVETSAPKAMLRKPIVKPLEVGIRAIDGLLTCGEGQRMGIFAAAGGGKSSLMAMLAKNADVDVTVVALIGERGREVREFIEQQLGDAGMKKAVVIVATSDEPAMQCVKAAYTATAVAEYFRDQNKKVLLLMDSVTRYARALREVGLALGEAPTRRGFPPSVFSMLPRLVERAGQSDKGSITAFYAVLVEGDDMNEPVADETRSLLDGHIILSRKLASANHFPAIDILESRSRIMDHIVRPAHAVSSAKVRELMSSYSDVELLVKIGEYEEGSDPLSDQAIKAYPGIRKFLIQSSNEAVSFTDTTKRLTEVVS